jgi:hypothetical protein
LGRSAGLEFKIFVKTMITAARPPAKIKQFQQKGRERPFFTLHLNHTDIFTIQNTEKTAVLAFTKKSDAHRFGTLLETTYENTKTWPMFRPEEDNWFKLEEKENLKYLTIVNWDPSILKSMCITSDFSMVEVIKFSGDEGTYRLVGRHYTWEADFDFYRSILEDKLL